MNSKPDGVEGRFTKEEFEEMVVCKSKGAKQD